MAKITVAPVKELRERTGAGVMECKKALVEASGDIELAIDNMRKAGQAKAAKKEERVATEGVILTKIAADGKYGVIVELNCETDFVAKDATFKAFGERVATVALNERIADVAALKAKLEERRTVLVAQIGENINIRRVSIQAGEMLGAYLHGTRIGVLVAAKGADAELIKHIAMHIAASKPKYLKAENVPTDIVAREYGIQLDIAMQSGKSIGIAEKIVEGRMRKFTDEISLTGQNFVMAPNKTVGDLLIEHKADVISFIRFEVGEGMQRKEMDFATEVAAVSSPKM